jgi:predicted nucleic-acid-binding protein
MHEHIGLDTSIVVRMLIGEPVEQAKLAADFVLEHHRNGSPCYVSDWVFSETYFVLVSHYGINSETAIRELKNMLVSGVVSFPGYAFDILSELRDGGPGLMDRLIRKYYLETCEKVMTFDKKFSRLDGVQLLEKNNP